HLLSVFPSSSHPPHLHSFPTRRSSDLLTLAEPGALIGFAGKRTIWNTVRLELPEGFQTSEFLMQHGFIDRIVSRKDLRTEVARRSEEHTSELQSPDHLVCRLLLEKKNN